MRQLESFPGAGKNNCVVANYVAAADRMHPDFLVRAFAHDAGATLANDLFELLLADLGQYLSQRFGGSAGGIALQPMMHLDDFQIEPGPQDFGCFARQPK